MLRVVSVNIALIAVVILVAELIFGTWFSDSHALYKFTKPRDVRISSQNTLSSAPAIIHYSRDSNGFRGLNGGVDEIDIITVGGSTTDQRYVDDTDTFQAVIRDLSASSGRELIVANAGIDGQSTFGHIENFPSWFARIDGLQARYILYFVGINDSLRIAGIPGFDEMEDESGNFQLKAFIKEKSAVYQIYRVGRSVLLHEEIGHVRKTEDLAISQPLDVDPVLAKEVINNAETQAALSDLNARIVQLSGLSRDFGAEPIFVTQRSALWTRLDGEVHGVPEIRPGFRSRFVEMFGGINGVDIYNIEVLIADTILDACHSTGAICIDLLRELDFEIAEDFYDEVHTTAEGSERIGRYLYSRLMELTDL